MASPILLSNLDVINTLVKDWVKAKETVVSLGSKHTAIQGSIDELHRHLDPASTHIANVLNVLDDESNELLKKINSEDIEFKRLDALLDKKYSELRVALKGGLDILRDIDRIRNKNTVDLSVIDLVDATHEKSPYHQLRPLPSISSNVIDIPHGVLDEQIAPIAGSNAVPYEKLIHQSSIMTA
jgi:hypothetical protein